MERGGNVKARVQTDLSGRGILRFLKGKINPEDSKLITDEYGAYRAIRPYFPHEVINHQVHYVDGDIHTNTIEGFSSLFKRAWYGSHHHYTKKVTPLFVVEACWKCNHRNVGNAFDVFLRGCFSREIPPETILSLKLSNQIAPSMKHSDGDALRIR